MADNEIGLQAIFENEQFQQGIAEYNSSVKDASSNTESGASTMSAAFDGLSAVGAIAFTAIGAGIAAMTAELYLAVDAAMETEQVMARMEFVVGNVGDRTGVTTEDVLALADSLSQILPIDDEIITSAITMGLTFDGVTKDNIEPLIAAAADLATWTGKDLPATMKELSMAISDPDKAMRLLRDANITLTDAEMKTLKAFKDTGDTAGATTFLLNELKEKGIIGLGEAMGETAQGKMTIMQTALGNIQEALGGGLLNALSGVFDRITVFANDPQTVTFFTDLGVKIGDFAEKMIARLPDIITSIESVVTWLSNNKPIIAGVLAAIGVAMLAFGYTAAAAGIAAMAGLWPVIAVMAAVGAAVALLYKAWTENWGGIQQKTAKLWAQLKPMFDKLQVWLAVNIPKALKVLSDFWTKTLLPAMQTVFEWIVNNAFPIIEELIAWLEENLPRAIKTLSDFWTKTLLPAIKAVGDFIDNVLIPILTVLRDWLETYLANALNTLSALWTNILLPAMTAVYNFITTILIPAFNAIATVISGVLTAAITTLSAVWTGVLLPAITAVYNFIQNFIMPVFNAVANLMDAVVGLAVRVLAGLWQNVLLPALSAVWGFIQNNIISVFNTVASVISGVLSSAITALSNLWTNVLLPAITRVRDALEPLASFLSGVLQSAFEGIRDIIQWVIDKINALADAISNIVLPPWLTPGSPTPFEMGLRGINAELAKLARASLPAIQHQMNLLATVRDVPSASSRSMGASISNSSQRTSNYLYGTNFNIPGPSGVIETLQGLS